MTLKSRLKYLISIILISLFIITSGCAYNDQPTLPHTATTQMGSSQVILEKANWDSFNHAELSQLIAQHGNQNSKYNPDHPPYVVFDFDNTSIFLDIEEAVFIYQLENLLFKVDPKSLNSIIRTGISSDNFSSSSNNLSGQAVNINKIAPDIIQSYQWLYLNYQGLKGTQSLEQVKLNPHYHNFRTKMRYLYEAIGESFEQETAYAWVTYLFAGFENQEVRDITHQSYLKQINSPIEQITWTSPTTLAGRSGLVKVTWNNGLRAFAEMQNLYQVLKNNGFDVYICSASFSEVVKEMATNPFMGFNIPEQHVFAFELERDPQHKIKPRLKNDYIQTLGKGKTQTIEKILVSHYGYGPLLVAGDSRGDVNMMQDFKDMQKVLIINRLSKSDQDIIKLSKIAAQQHNAQSEHKTNTKYLLQGRDANTGKFIASIESMTLGSHVKKVFSTP
ncbi:haloacid dehalogenase-like hydrolase [Acinetobacter calcoaceticus]|uniref:phosphoserine phosphatase n=1 Tax=Acinetobacter calcoaceticus TaxID=471 RepID=A0A4R1XQS7_ACICA|nr:haloacid dehalogenase-like hydrolase [Acinetobacter calcoaceticus]